MAYLAKNPIGKKTKASTTDIAQWLTQLPKRHALVRSGTDVGTMYTLVTPKRLTGDAATARVATVLEQTRVKYCLPRTQVEQHIRQEPTPADVLVTQVVPAVTVARAVHQAITTRQQPPAPVSRWTEVDDEP